MTDEAENRLRLTSALWAFAQRAFPKIMIDVVYWDGARGNHRIAFVGNPLKVAMTFGMLGDGSGETTAFLGARLGQDVRATLVPSMSREDLFSDWERAGMSLGELLSRLTSQTAWQWAEANGPIGDEGTRIGFIPDPGWPWPCDGERYWSAREKAWKKSARPPWLIEVEDPFDNHKPTHGVNPCLVFTSDETKTDANGPVCGLLEGEPLIVTHAMDLSEPNQATGWVKSHKQLDTAIAGIKACGGLLMPSLAVGPIPATNFGPIVLVAHLELVLDSLLPYRRGSRRRPCWVYGNDAWTTSTGGMMQTMAIELFEELHGNEDWQGRYIATLGMPAHMSHGEDEFPPLTSTKRLAGAIRVRMRQWKRNLSHEAFNKLSEDATQATKFAYTEAKAREVVRLDEFPFLVAPKSMKRIVDHFVKGVGYPGQVVFLDAGVIGKDEWYTNNERAYNLYQWGWKVADAVRQLRSMPTVLV